MVEITTFRLERIFQPMRALKFITGHMVIIRLILKSYRRQWPFTLPSLALKGRTGVEQGANRGKQFHPATIIGHLPEQSELEVCLFIVPLKNWKKSRCFQTKIQFGNCYVVLVASWGEKFYKPSKQSKQKISVFKRCLNNQQGYIFINAYQYLVPH